jgi:glycosyltransferase involved in cell wall biosynthesis
MHIALNTLAVRARLSGGGVYVTNLVRSLAGLDHRNQYTLYMSGQNAAHFCGLPENFRLVQAVSLRPLRLLWEQTLLPLQLARGGVTLFHATGNVSPLIRTCRQVVTIHDLTYYLMPERHTLAKRNYFRMMIAPSARRSDRVITVSDSSKDDIVRLLRIAPEKVTVIHEGCDVRYRPLHDQDALNALRRKYSLRKRILLFLGMIEPGKNLVNLLAAFARLREFHGEYCLVLAGDFGWNYRPVLAAIERLGLRELVHLPGYIPEEELPALYNLAEVLVYPSLYEGFGLPVLEAMACGIPVITSNVSSMPEVAGDAAVLVEPRSVEQLSNALSRVLTDADLRAQMSEKGLERSRMFTWEKAARETMQVYEEVAGS